MVRVQHGLRPQQLWTASTWLDPASSEAELECCIAAVLLGCYGITCGVLTLVMPTKSFAVIRALHSTKSMESLVMMRLAGVCSRNGHV